jgi:hypothetical protein
MPDKTLIGRRRGKLEPKLSTRAGAIISEAGILESRVWPFGL